MTAKSKQGTNSPPEPSGERKPKKRRWLRRLGIGCGACVVLLVVGVVVVPLLLPDALTGSIVAWKLEGNLNREATVDGASFSIFSGFKARGISIQRRDGFGDGHLATIGQLSAKVDYAALLGGTIRVEDIRIEDVDAHLIRDSQGILNIQDILEQPSSGIKLGQIAAKNVTLHLADQEHGVAETITVAEADVSAVAEGQRTLKVSASLLKGGSVGVAGTVHVTPESEELDRASIQLTADSIAVGKHLAAFLQRKLKGRVPLGELEPLSLTCDLTLGLDGDRKFSGKGTVTLHKFPAVPELALDKADRALVIALDGRGSPDGVEIDVAINSKPGDGVRVTLHVDDRLRKKGAGAFEIENFFVDARAEIKGQLKRGLPGTPLRGGDATLVATAKGSIEELAATLKTVLDGASVQGRDGKLIALPQFTFETEARATLNEKGLAAEVTRYAFTTEALAVTGSASARREADAEVIALRAVSKTKIDFDRLPRALVQLLQMPVAGGTPGGTLEAHASAGFDLGERTPDGWVPTPGKVALKAGLELKGFAVRGGTQPVPPSDLIARANVVADLESLSVQFTDTMIRGSGIHGSIEGSVSLATDAQQKVTGNLEILLAEVTRRYGALLGIPPGLDVAGKVTWRLEAEQQGNELVLRGTTDVTDVAIGGKAWTGKPFREPKAQFVHDLVWNREKGLITVKAFRIAATGIQASAQGTVALPGSEAQTRLALELEAAPDASPVVLARSLVPETLGDLEVTGKASADLVLRLLPGATVAEGTLTWRGGRIRAAGHTITAGMQSSFEATVASGTLKLRGSGHLDSLAVASPRIEPNVFREKKLSFRVDVAASVRARSLTIAALRVDGRRVRLSITGTATADALDLKLGGKVATELVALVPNLPARLKELKLSGPAEFDIAVTGKPTDARLVGYLDGKAIQVAFRDLLRKPAGAPARVDFDASLARSAINVRKADLQFGGIRASARFAAPLNLSKIDGKVEAATINLADVAALSPLAATFKPTGKVGVNLALGGSLTKPELKGTVSLASCSAQLPKKPKLRPVVNGQLIAAGADLTVEKLVVALGEDSIEIAGTARNAAAFPATQIDLVVASPRIDLDRLLAGLGLGKAPPPAKPPLAPATGWKIGEATTKRGPAPALPPALPPASAKALFPDLPPELQATLKVNIAEILYDKRKIAAFHVDAKLEKSIVELTKVSAKPMGGTLEVSGRLALGGKHEHALNITVANVHLDSDVHVLGKIPFLNIFFAALGGMPHKMDFAANMQAKLTSAGNTDAALRRNAAGTGTVMFANMHISGAPMFKLLATLSSHPELADMRFERVDIPFTITRGLVANTLTMPYEEGQFFAQGTTSLPTEQVSYRVTIRNPRGMRVLPKHIVEYVEAGNPIMRVGGTLKSPKPQMVTLPDILRFLAQRKAKGRVGDLLRGVLGGDEKK